MNSTLGFHPLANLFPLIEGAEFDALVADVQKNGVREDVDLFEGLILDGRNRYRAAGAAGVDVRLKPFEGSYAEAMAYVVSKNVHRRHLNESQRSMVGARLATMAPGRPSETPSIEGVSAEAASVLVNVGKASVERAREVLRSGDEALIKAVDQGHIAVSVAQKAARLPVEQQRDVAKEAVAGHANVVRNVVQRAARSAKEQALGQKQRELPDKKYGVILADPEWEFVVFSRATGLDRSADNHYPTSSEKTIAARDVQKIAAKDCVLFLWTTDLARGNRVLESWGFAPKSYVVWVKDIIEIQLPAELAEQLAKLGFDRRIFAEVGPPGTGFWNRDRDEILLIGTRGNVPAPSMGTQGESVIFAARPKREDADRGKHSAKPTYVHEWIEEHFPNLPKIELNARAARRGWEAWGFEAPDALPPHDPETGEVLEETTSTERVATPAAPMASTSSGVAAGETASTQGDEHEIRVEAEPPIDKRRSGAGHRSRRVCGVGPVLSPPLQSSGRPDGGAVVGRERPEPDRIDGGITEGPASPSVTDNSAGLRVGTAFKPVAKDPEVGAQYVEHIDAPQTPVTPSAWPEIPAFLDRRNKPTSKESG